MLHQIRYFFFTAIILAIAFPQAVLGQNREWQAPILPPYTYNDIHIFDDLKAVAVGSSGIMIWTEDAGENWEVRQSVNGVTATFISVSFFDENHGIAVGSASGGNGALLHTKDGGVTWEPDRSFPYVVSLLSDVVMVSETVAYASGTQGRVFKTTNGGATWSVKNVGESRTLHAIHFFDADNGLTIGQFGSIYKTEDGGDNWVKITSGTNNELFNIQFIDDDLGFIGARAQFLKTTDGGETWDVTVPEGVRYVRAMKFFNENDGILISSN